MHSTPWLLRKPGVSARLRLICFCYAGGDANSFMTWQDALDPAIEVCAVQLPGRGNRFHETPFTTMPELIAALATEINSLDGLPFVFFGHSLGGLLAFELARYNMRHALSMPQQLFISGCAAARYRGPSKELHRLNDKDLLEKLRKYNGTPPEILANKELMELVLPTIRADFALVDNYRYLPGPLLHTPITVLAGKSDDFDSPMQVEGWQEETLGTCRIEWFGGDHFFIQAQRQEVLNCLNTKLKHLLTAGSFPHSSKNLHQLKRRSISI